MGRRAPLDLTASDSSRPEPAVGSPPTIVVQAPRTPLMGWVVAAGLLVIAACLVLRPDGLGAPPVFAQQTAHAGARGVFAFTGQLSKGTFGVFMVDVDAGTLWCYEYVPAKRELRFVASRSWLFDRYLKEFNASDPPVADIERLVEQQRARELQAEAEQAFEE